MTTKGRFIVSTLVSAAGLFGASLFLRPVAVFACTNPSPLPSGFATPCPVFDAEPTTVSQTGTVAVSATPNAPLQYISQTFYLYNGSAWQGYNFTGNFKKGYATSTASFTLNSSILAALPTGTVYLAEWDWTWDKTQNCLLGPGSTVCKQGSWRIQAFTLTGNGGGGGGGNTPPTTYSSRTDLCETGNEPGCSGKGLSFLGLNATSSNGSYVPLQTAPGIGGLYGANLCVNDPDFGAKICRVTDYSMGSLFNAGAAGDAHWSSNGSMFIAIGSGNTPYLFSFSNDNNMVSALSDIGRITSGGSGTTFANQGLAFSSINPNVIYEIDSGRVDAGGNPIVVLNQLTVNTSGAPSTWSLARTPIFDFEEGNPGHPAGSCLQFAPDGVHPFIPNWHGTMSVSGDDQSFSIALSDDGQNGKRINNNYGATFLVNFTRGKGCRVLNTYGTNGVGPMTIWGDWGYTGPVYDGSGMPAGQTGGNPLPDVMYLHGASAAPSSPYTDFSGSDLVKGSSTGSCVFSGKQSDCEDYFWETATGNVRPVFASGHATNGFLYQYRGKLYSALSYASTTYPATPLLPIPVPIDQHGTYNNADTQDDQPVFLASTNVCDQAPGMQGAGACDPQYTGPLYDEVFAVQNQAAHPGVAQSCNYGNGSTACAYRFAHTFNTGSNWNFYTQNAEGEVSPTGKFFMFASDWNLTLGCANGQASNCLDSITASASSTCAKNSNGQACQRGDVFVVQLQ